VTELQAEIIIALADNNLKIAEVARKIYMHRSTVVYHIKKIHRITGKNPLDFRDMCELLPIARRTFGDA
jgi:DNA-binding PucR family transcriptional regulator